ncbi:hypothetical protein C4N23_00415 [Faecalibacterium hattorii]|uniref:Uncharacterized protein n=1 Tax=Faecalibacterium hattorii TaxID=2935520 RepID=A0A329UQ48_9FIRM|nr:hypothetical protein C4N23_00415 [Faecalibacterium hattorii]
MKFTSAACVENYLSLLRLLVKIRQLNPFRVQPMMVNGIRKAVELVRMYVTFTIAKMETLG